VTTKKLRTLYSIRRIVSELIGTAMMLAAVVAQASQAPLENISNTKRITAVIVNGKLIPKVSLDKMLTDAEAAANKN
jgi:hypothetical protein